MKKVFFLVSLIVFFLGCEREDTETTGIMLPEELKEYFIFDSNSEWIYFESKTKQYDTITVIHSIYAIRDNSSSDIVMSEDYYEVITYSTFKKLYYSDTPMFWTTTDKTQGSGHHNIRSLFVDIDSNLKYSNSDSLIGFEYIFVSPAVEKVKLGIIEFNSKITSIQKNKEINSKVYEDVICVEVTNNPLEDLNFTKYYFARNYGLIQKEVIDIDQNWSLISFENYD
ncbi:hypothetical protein ACFLTE_09035 [Bacteroidota bacterium]